LHLDPGDAARRGVPHERELGARTDAAPFVERVDAGRDVDGPDSNLTGAFAVAHPASTTAQRIATSAVGTEAVQTSGPGARPGNGSVLVF
jgi:hypothetical protein